MAYDRYVSIPELGLNTSSNPILSNPQTTRPNDEWLDTEPKLEFENAPFSTWMYTDHIKKNDYVCVLLPVIYGATNLSFDLAEDGYSVTINYTWPKEFYNSTDLFKQSIADKEISAEHPKVHAFVSNWVTAGITENSQPKGKITINLPCKVKREIGSWVKKAMTVNNTNLIMLEFTAYQKALLVNDADTSLNFV